MFVFVIALAGSPGSSVVKKKSACQCKETQEMLFRSLGWEDPLEKEIAIHLPGESHGQRNLVGYSQVGTELDTTDLA